MQTELLSALRMALENEFNGHKLYSRVASEAKDAFTRNTFSNLAADEEKHIEAIQKFIGRGTRKPAPGPASLIGKAEVGAKMKFFGENVERFRARAAAAQSMDLGPYRMGLELEKKSFEFYRTQSRSAKAPEIVKFFSFLMEQEELHFNLIKQAINFLERPHDYFMTNEGFRLDGAV
jgi:rubrerythrin